MSHYERLGTTSLLALLIIVCIDRDPIQPYYLNQGGLNKKEIQLNFPFWYLTLFIRLMTLNRKKLGRAVTFMKYLAGVVCSIFTKNFNLE